MGVTDYVMKKEYGEAYSSWNPEIDIAHSSMDSFQPTDLAYFIKNHPGHDSKKKK